MASSSSSTIPHITNRLKRNTEEREELFRGAFDLAKSKKPYEDSVLLEKQRRLAELHEKVKEAEREHQQAQKELQDHLQKSYTDYCNTFKDGVACVYCVGHKSQSVPASGLEPRTRAFHVYFAYSNSEDASSFVYEKDTGTLSTGEIVEWEQRKRCINSPDAFGVYISHIRTEYNKNATLEVPELIESFTL